MRLTSACFASLIAVLLTTGCGDDTPLVAERYAPSNVLLEIGFGAVGIMLIRGYKSQ
jgi:hypothetical protein